jgi:hypothetical protein
VTLSPFRAAFKSAGGLGNSSDGAVGGPIEAHPTINMHAPSANICLNEISIRQKQQSTSLSQDSLRTDAA